MRGYILRSLITVTVALLLVTALPPGMCQADIGDFWFGVTSTHTTGGWGGDVYRILDSAFHMNWVMDFSTGASRIATISANNLNVVVWPYGISDDSNKVYRFSKSHFLQYQAEGDTIVLNWDPSDYGSYVEEAGGSKVYDDDATRDSAWFFKKGLDTAGSQVWARSKCFVGRKVPREVQLRFRMRTIPNPQSSQALAYFQLFKRKLSTVLREDTIRLSQFPDAAYHEFVWDLGTYTKADTVNWGTNIIVEWTGAESLWVDWIADTDPDGYLLESTDADDEIRSFADHWTFDDTAVIAFAMSEERDEDANVHPQYWVDSLIKEELPGRHGFTQNHWLEWWPTYQRYGARVAASAYLEKESHVSGLFYPLSGYNPVAILCPSHPYQPQPAYICTTLAVYQKDMCGYVVSDTATCFQKVLDENGQILRHFKTFCQSLTPSAKYVPHLQAFSGQDRQVPTFCGQDTSWYTGFRPGTEQEYKCLAGFALANGVNGLIYFKYGGYRDSVKFKLEPCMEDSAWFVTKVRDGLNTLTELQDALEYTIGPFLDSLGSYFADPDFWKGGGRVDPITCPDSAGIGDLFDSVKSITFTEEGDSAFIEAGVYEDDAGDDYFLLVNRRVSDTMAQEIRSWLDLDTGMYYIVDLYSYDSVLTGSLPTGEVPFKTSLDPGEFKFFKILPVDSGYVAGSSVPEQWEGGIRVGGDITVDSSRSLMILGPADVRVDSGGAYRFNAYGPVTIQGTAEQPIAIHSSADSAAAGKQDWFGIIKHNGPGDVMVAHAEIANAYKGIWIIDTTATITATIDHCCIGDGYMSGVWVETDTSSTVTISNSDFYDITYYGVQIYKGVATVDSNLFYGYFLNAVRVEGSGTRVTGGVIRECLFDGLERNNSYAVNLQSISNDMRDHTDTAGYILGDNTFGGSWDGNNMTAIYVYDCDDSLRFYCNYIRGSGGSSPAYGILNFNTQTYIDGDTSRPAQDSKIEEATYGLYCMSSMSSITEHAIVRECYFDDCVYNVYVTSNCTVDLGKDKLDWGLNTFWVSISSDSCNLLYPPSWNVYNCNSSDSVQAAFNYWAEWDTCDHYPHISGLVNWEFPLRAPPGQGKIVTDCGEVLSSVGVSVVSPENYPNPFNSSTIIQFYLKKPGPVDVTVYNVLGQRVATLCTGEREAGIQHVPWDGRNARGQPVSSGIYFYRIRTVDQEITKKMVIVK